MRELYGLAGNLDLLNCNPAQVIAYTTQLNLSLSAIDSSLSLIHVRGLGVLSRLKLASVSLERY